MTDWGDKIDKEIDPQISWLFELAKNGLQIISMNMLKNVEENMDLVNENFLFPSFIEI